MKAFRRRAWSVLLLAGALLAVAAGGVQAQTAAEDAARVETLLADGMPSPQAVNELVAISQRASAAAPAAFRAGDLDEAVALFGIVLGIDEALLPAGHAKIVASLHNLAFVSQRAGRYDEAEAHYRRALAIRETTLPANHPEIAVNLADLGSLLAATGRAGEAEQLYERALAVREASLPANDPLIVRSLVQLARMYDITGRYEDEEGALRRALALQEAALPPGHPDLVPTLRSLALVLSSLRRIDESETAYRGALAIQRLVQPEGHPDMADTMAGLGDLLAGAGRYEEAELLLRQALADREAALGDHPDTAASLHALGALEADLGRHDEAEAHLRRAIALREQAPDLRRSLANSLTRLAEMHRQTGRYAESEALHKRALLARESVLPGTHPEISQSLNGLAQVYGATGRDEEAETLYRRSLAVRREGLPADHPLVRSALNNLASLLYRQGRYGEAESLWLDAFGGRSPLDGDDPDLSPVMDNLAQLYGATGRLEEAQALSQHALDLTQKHLGPTHPRVAAGLNNLAGTLVARGDLAGAERLYRRALEIARTSLPALHPNTGGALTNLAFAVAAQGRFAEAAVVSREGIDILLKRQEADLQPYRGEFLQHTQIALSLEAGVPEAFEAHQWPLGGAAGTAIAEARARAEGDTELSDLARRRDGLADEIAATDRLISDTLGAGGTVAADMRRRYDELVAAGASAEADLADRFPAYADFARPGPLGLRQAQDLLGPDDVLVSFMLTGGDADAMKGFVFAVTADAVTWDWIADSREAMQLSSRLRTLMTGGDRGAATLSTAETPANRRSAELLDASHRLYRLLLGPVAAALDGKRNLIVVPDPYLAELPVHMLVTDAPRQLAGSEAFKAARWLIRDHTVTVLPAISSLRALRGLRPEGTRAAKPFLAFADPVIGTAGSMHCGEAETTRLADADTRAAAVPAALFAAGGFAEGRPLANVEAVRGLVRLPDTRCEALAISSALGGSRDALFFEDDASEARIKSLSGSGALADHRVLLFATHGLAPGDIGSAEPALVLTPPLEASALDDGLLTASEVAGLRLDADFVILSACNTAAAGSAGGQSFSGLARAFFYAGARSLLVSHWPVHSDAAVKLTTRALAAGPGVSRAEAMRRSMLAMIDDPDHPRDADPVRWAPFSLVGESAGL